MRYRARYGATASSGESRVVAVLALASASRLYLVTTLGERIVAVRRDVFSHLTSLSPAFFD